MTTLKYTFENPINKLDLEASNEVDFKIENKTFSFKIMNTEQRITAINNWNNQEKNNSQFYSKYSLPIAQDMNNLRLQRLYWQCEQYKPSNDKKATKTKQLLEWDIQNNIRDKNGNWLFEQKLFSILGWLFNPKGNTQYSLKNYTQETLWKGIEEYMVKNNINSLYTLKNDEHKDNFGFVDTEARKEAKKTALDRKNKLAQEKQELEKLRNQENNFSIKSNIKDTIELQKHIQEFLVEVFKLNKDLHSKWEKMPTNLKNKVFASN